MTPKALLLSTQIEGLEELSPGTPASGTTAP